LALLRLCVRVQIERPSEDTNLAEHMPERPAAGRNIGGQDHKGLVVSRDAVSTWFLREILPLEPILMHYLRLNWRNASDIPDLRQEIYARVLQAARDHIPDSPKRFLLTSARNLLIDRVRREQVVPMETFADFDALGIAADAPEPERMIIEQEELRRVEAALAQLPSRTREAIELTYFEGLSCMEIARRMGVTKQTASRFIARGTLVLGRILYSAPADRSTGS
jgi:RNA polymerase sigma factor (sigma-70 family)